MKVDIPNVFICQLTRQIMHKPVTTKTGYNFESDAIKTWVSLKGVCPNTREPLTLDDIFENFSLKSNIQAFVETNIEGITLDDYYNEEHLQNLKYVRAGLGTLQQVVDAFNNELTRLGIEDDETDEDVDVTLDIRGTSQAFIYPESGFFDLILTSPLYILFPLSFFHMPAILPTLFYFNMAYEYVDRYSFLPRAISFEDRLPLRSQGRMEMWEAGIGMFIVSMIVLKLLVNLIYKMARTEHDFSHEGVSWYLMLISTLAGLMASQFYAINASDTVNSTDLRTEFEPNRRMTDEDAAAIVYSGTLSGFFQYASDSDSDLDSDSDDSELEDAALVVQPISWARQAYNLTRGFVDAATTPDPEDRGWRPIGRLFNSFAP